jgi:hypothetical protein
MGNFEFSQEIGLFFIVTYWFSIIFLYRKILDTK